MTPMQKAIMWRGGRRLVRVTASYEVLCSTGGQIMRAVRASAYANTPPPNRHLWIAVPKRLTLSSTEPAP